MPQGAQISHIGAPAQRYDEIGFAAPNGRMCALLQPVATGSAQKA